MSESKYIVAGSLIDGTGAEVRKNVYLKVQDTIITAIGSTDNLPQVDTSAVHDFSHCTIVPAMVDCNVYLLRSPSVNAMVRLAAQDAGQDEKKILLEKHISYCHSHGVLGVSDSDEISGLIKRQQENLIDVRTADRDFIRIRFSQDIEGEQLETSLVQPDDLYKTLQEKNRNFLLRWVSENRGWTG